MISYVARWFSLAAMTISSLQMRRDIKTAGAIGLERKRKQQTPW
jgi:hypothetical protein